MINKKLRVYLDNCCFNRPYDNQSQLKIELETKAKLHIQSLIAEDKVDLVISYMSEFENNDNPFLMKKTAIADFFKYAKENITENLEIIETANSLKKSGLKTKDSLHLACAIVSKCDYFMSTDDRLLKHKDKRIKIINPINFILEEGKENV